MRIEPCASLPYGQFPFQLEKRLSGIAPSGAATRGPWLRISAVKIAPERPKEPTMKVLMVLTSHDQLGDTGRKTGFWLEELAAPYYVFKDARAQITLASPKGGHPPLDPKSQDPSFQTDITRRFEKDADAEGQLDKTVRLESVEQEDCDARASSPPREPRFAIARRSTSNEPLRSNHRIPRRRDEPIAAAGLLDVAEAGEREVIARDQELVGRSHVVDAAARRHGLLRLVVEHDLPIGVAQEQVGHVGDVALEEQLRGPRGDDEGGVPGRVAAGLDRGDAGSDLAAPFIARHLVREVGENLAVESERGLGEALWRPAHVVVVHPERPVDGGHLDLGIGEGERSVRGLEPEDMVAVQVRDQDDVDCVRIKASGGQGRGQQPDRRTEAGAIAGVDQHELGAGVDYDRIERRDDAALRHIGGLGGREYLLVTDIAHELGGERNGSRAVIDDGDFELADLAAIEARRLPAGERRGGLRGRGERRECAGGGGRAGGGNDAATG